MTIAYACDLNVYVCVNFGDKILLRGEECKTWEKFNFSETWKKTIKLPKWFSETLKFF